MAAPLSKRLKRFLRYLAIRVALSAVQLMSARSAGALGERFGSLAFRVAGAERRKALDSLQRAFPHKSEAEREQLARASFRHLGRLVFELACVREIDREIDAWVEFPEEDRRVLERALAGKQGVVFVSGHVGNWELLARRVSTAGFPSQSIAKETSDPRLTELVERFRSEGGLKSIWRGRDGAAKDMLRALKQGEILGLLIDQDTKVQSVFVPFFGHPASTPRAAADLVYRTGAAAVVGFCQRGEGGRYRLSIKEVEVDRSLEREAGVIALTATLTREIEEAIRRAPEQWVWMHRRWKTRPADQA